jgi:hypothetical protein
LRQSVLAWDREARHLARLVDLGGNRGGSGLVWGVGAGGGGEGRERNNTEAMVVEFSVLFSVSVMGTYLAGAGSRVIGYEVMPMFL